MNHFELRNPVSDEVIASFEPGLTLDQAKAHADHYADSLHKCMKLVSFDATTREYSFVSLVWPA